MLYTEDVCGAAELLIWSHFFPLITHHDGPAPESLLTSLTNIELPQFAAETNLPPSSSAASLWWKICSETGSHCSPASE